MFSSLSGVRLIFKCSLHKYTYRNDTRPKIPIKLSMMFNYCTQFPQNWQSSLTVNISRSTAIQHVYCVPLTFATLLAVVLAPLPLRLIYRTQQWKRTRFRWSTSFESWRYNFVKKLSRVRNWQVMRSDLLCSKFYLLPRTPMHGKQVNLNSELSFLAQYRFIACVQRSKNI